MIQSLSLRNFQSWRSLDLRLAPVTMLVGRGDVGKSAVVRAITYALTNQGGDAFIRDGAAEAQVALSFDDDFALLWTKPRGKGAVYHLITDDGEREFTKTGQSVPQAVQEVTGFREIEIDKGFTISPQFTQQFDKPFIVEESGSRTARILGKLTRLDVLVQAQMICRRDRDAARRDAEASQKRSEEVQARLDALPDVDTLRRRYDATAAAVQAADDARGRVADAEALVEAYRQARRLADLPVSDVSAALADARDAVDRYTVADAARQSFTRAVAEYELAKATLTVAEAQQAEAGAAYDAECREAGLCKECPFR
jgi:DNA repair ATPase RecN